MHQEENILISESWLNSLNSSFVNPFHQNNEVLMHKECNLEFFMCLEISWGVNSSSNVFLNHFNRDCNQEVTLVNQMRKSWESLVQSILVAQDRREINVDDYGKMVQSLISRWIETLPVNNLDSVWKLVCCLLCGHVASL